jgi:predicted ATP-dependent endonuclease of OLD family
MYTLKHIEIDGFWGKQKLSVDLQHDVNIFIGPNGTGKTTLINALQACMTLDLQLLNRLSFLSIKIELISGKSLRTIKIAKSPTDGVFDQIEYRISREVFKVPLVPRDVEYRRRIPPRHIEKIRELRTKLADLAETSWLSVHRELLEEDGYETHMRGSRVEEILNPIDARLFRLLERLQTYQMRLQAEANKLSFKFQRSVLTSLLYNKSFDTFDLEKESEIDYDDLKNQLINAYDALGVLNEGTLKRIDNHISIIQTSISKLLDDLEHKKSLHVNDVLPLSLLKRSRHLAKLSTENDEQKKILFEQLDLFVKTLRGFLADKEIKLSPSQEGGIAITKNDIPLRINNLSSGEKQVFILLAETLLQERRNAIFLADEPELSLHIAWQRDLLSAIRTLNPNAQMIVATHSPEIAGNWDDRLIDMEDILS